MIYVLNIFLVFQVILYKTISPNFINVCFTSVLNRKININFQVSADLPFIPDLIQVEIYTKKELVEVARKIFDFEYHLLEKAGFPCSDALEYKVLLRGEPLIVINFTVFWGDERFVIEKFQMIVLQDFVAGFHILEGLLGHMMLAVSLDLDYTVPKNSVSLKFYIPNIHWSTEIRTLYSGECFCMAFFTREFTKIMVLTEDSFDHNQPLEYYIFTASTEHFGEDQGEERSYLVKIYPCKTPVDSQNIAEIYVHEFDVVIDFKLSEKAHKHIYRIRYRKHHLKFIKETNHPSFEFKGLEVKAVKSLQDVINESGGIFLIYISENWLPCNLKLPYPIKKFENSYVQQIGSIDVLVGENLHFIDTSTEGYRVFPIRLATKSEIEQCKL